MKLWVLLRKIMSNLVVYKEAMSKAPKYLYPHSTKRAIKKLWFHATGKKWGPGKVWFTKDHTDNTVIQQHKVIFNLKGGWPMLVWVVASSTYQPSYTLEGRAGGLAAYAQEQGFFKRGLKRRRRLPKMTKHEEQEVLHQVM